MEELEFVQRTLVKILVEDKEKERKNKCLGYCESPSSFFMRQWKNGKIGALKMGIYHGLYCLGCCWPYFLIMVSLGCMNIGWMAYFL
jgi:predicted metal-binding membrane protein